MDNPRDDPARQRRLARRRELYRLHRAAETSDQCTRYKLEQCSKRIHTGLKLLLLHIDLAHSTLPVGLYYIQLGGESAC